MQIHNKIGRIDDMDIKDRSIDYWDLEWYECNKRIIRKKTRSSVDVSFKSLNSDPFFTEGDVIFENEKTIIAVSVLACDCIIVKPRNTFELASLCFEIGNKHASLFYENEILLLPFESPLFNQLLAQGYSVRKEKRKLLTPLKTSVAAHAHLQNESLFTKIMKFGNNE